MRPDRDGQRTAAPDDPPAPAALPPPYAGLDVPPVPAVAVESAPAPLRPEDAGPAPKA